MKTFTNIYTFHVSSFMRLCTLIGSITYGLLWCVQLKGRFKKKISHKTVSSEFLSPSVFPTTPPRLISSELFPILTNSLF